MTGTPITVSEASTPLALDGWASLERDAGLYVSGRWLAYADVASGASSRYLLASAGESPVAALSVHEHSYGFGREYDASSLFADGDGSAGDSVLLGGYRGYRSEILRGASDLLLDLLRRLLAEAAQGREWWWPYLGGEDALLLLGIARTMDESASLHFVSADTRVSVRSSFDDHLAALQPKQRRTNARRELIRAEELGLSVRIMDLRDVWERLVPLLVQVQAKYGQNADPDALGRLLRLQAEHLGDLGLVFACVDASGKIVGFSLCYRSTGRLSLRIVGFDYPRLQTDEYALVAIHSPVRYAAENGIAQVHLGIDSYGAKIRRGARPSTLWAVTSHGLRDDERTRRRVTAFAEGLPSHEAAVFRAEAAAVLARSRSSS